ncbi:AraC family transcriptional regulator [Nonomuraea sp. WAC 01424]|uniref:AraC family transcriptional regulator n=1 Tax=Nonomuraea sp. WAC 01424 TaxID=2203200 RepID=UPI0021AE017C|nr:AraC family transcriptional regulator [Nonomuraea sp. WAC 01424]
MARRVGYEDAAYFSRIFTRRTGVSPRAFREREQRTSADAPPLPVASAEGVPPRPPGDATSLTEAGVTSGRGDSR